MDDLRTTLGNRKIQERKPFQGELDYFKSNPNVGGMATEDRMVIRNPYTQLSPEEQEAVMLNERSRVLMRSGAMRPSFMITPEQTQSFKGYGTEQDIRETIAGRLLSGDPSAGKPTEEQSRFIRNFISQQGKQ